MQKLGDDLLAGAVFTGNENVGVRWAHLADEFEHGLHGRGSGHEVGHSFSPQQTIFEFELTRTAKCLVQFGVNANQRDEALVFPGFLDEIAGAALDAFDGEVDIAPGSHDDDGHARIDLLQSSKQIESFLAGGRVTRVVKVDEQHIVVGLAERLEKKLRRTHTIHMNALRLK